MKSEEEASVLRFYKIVLSWDYLRILKEAERKYDKKKPDGDGSLLKVKSRYTDVDDYFDVFEPLLFEEVKSHIIQQKDEEEETVWLQAIVAECNEINGFHLPAIICLNADSVSQSDLLLVSTAKFGEGKHLPTAYAFALVDHRQNDKIKLRLYLSGEIKSYNVDDVRPCQRLHSMLPIVSEVQKCVYVLKLCSLSTILREYVAMRSIGSLPFKDIILKAADTYSSNAASSWTLPRPLEDLMKREQNESQMDSIYAVLSHKPLVLIQGPPGTGKTRTILGILNAICHSSPPRVSFVKGNLNKFKHGRQLTLHEKYEHWLKASPWLTGISPRDKIGPKNGDDGFFPTTGIELKPEVVDSNRTYRNHVLVCAPSNSALDEIVYRLLKTGLYDDDGKRYNPKIVRIGLNPHHSIHSVSMDYLVEQKLTGSVAKDKDAIRASIVDEAVIVFSTLSFSGSTIFNKLNRPFDVVVIDEAAQAVEPSILVPLAHGCKQLFLVGDPRQLPATVISQTAQKSGYGMSLFERLQMANYPIVMLNTQYRMHPEISSFPSKEFYDGNLLDGPDVRDLTRRSWHKFRCFGPFCFFDIQQGAESQTTGRGSWINRDEVDFIIELYSKLVKLYPELKDSSRLAMISPYRHQVRLLRDKFFEAFDVKSEKYVDINTVDGFQGREKDVVIFSCVRASKDKGIGFVSDFRRMNVGITRAKSSVLVVGCASTLRRDEHWSNLIGSVEKRNLMFKVSKPYGEFVGDGNLEAMEVEEMPPPEEDDDDDNNNENGVDSGPPNSAAADLRDEEEGFQGMDDGGFDDDMIDMAAED